MHESRQRDGFRHEGRVRRRRPNGERVGTEVLTHELCEEERRLGSLVLQGSAAARLPNNVVCNDIPCCWDEQCRASRSQVTRGSNHESRGLELGSVYTQRI